MYIDVYSSHSKQQILNTGESLFENNFSDCSIKEAESSYQIGLGPADVFEIALLYILESSKKSIISRLPESIDKLYTYVHEYKKSYCDESTSTYSNEDLAKMHELLLYIKSMDALKASKFKSISLIDDVFDGLKKEGITSKTYKELIESEEKAEGLWDVSNFACRIFNAITDQKFDEELTENLDNWLPNYFPKTIFDAFDMEYISLNAIEKQIDNSLKEMWDLYEKDHNRGRDDTYDFKYIEKVNRIANALDFIKRLSVGKKVHGKKKDSAYYPIYQNIFSNVKGKAEDYFNIDIAIKTIRQNNEKYEDSAVEKSLNVLELISKCEGAKSENEIQKILENYIDASHPLWKDIHDRKTSNNLKGRMTTLYQNFGGNTDSFKTPAKIYREKLNKQKKKDAETRQIEPEPSRASTFITEEDTDIGYQRPIDRYDIGNEIIFTVTNIPPSAEGGGKMYGKTGDGLTVIFKGPEGLKLGYTLNGDITHKKANHLNVKNIEIIPRNDVIDL